MVRRLLCCLLFWLSCFPNPLYTAYTASTGGPAVRWGYSEAELELLELLAELLLDELVNELPATAVTSLPESARLPPEGAPLCLLAGGPSCVEAVFKTPVASISSSVMSSQRGAGPGMSKALVSINSGE